MVKSKQVNRTVKEAKQAEEEERRAARYFKCEISDLPEIRKRYKELKVIVIERAQDKFAAKRYVSGASHPYGDAFDELMRQLHASKNIPPADKDDDDFEI